MNPKNLVLGGTGHYGRVIVSRLLSKGAQVRVMARNAERGRAILGDTAKVIEGDVTSPESVSRALDGVRTVTLAVSAFSWSSIKDRMKIERDAMLRLIEQAESAGVARVVYLSGYDVRPELMQGLGLDELAKPMLDVQAALARSQLNWTVIGCAPSMEMYFAMIRGKTMTVPGGGPPAMPTVSPHDVGEVAAQALLRTDLKAQRIRVPGPEALSFPDAARTISKVWGKPIGYRPIPLAPIKVAAFLTRPLNPYVQHLLWAVTLMNNFPQQLAAEVSEDHARLCQMFDFEPTTLEAEARRRMA